MFDRRDRPQLAVMALNVLVVGIVIGPFLHLAFAHGVGSVHRAPPFDPRHFELHAHSAAHQHAHEDSAEGDRADQHGHHHAPGSTEHLVFVALTPDLVLAPASVFVALDWVRARIPAAPALVRPRLRAMPQGP